MLCFCDVIKEDWGQQIPQVFLISEGNRFDFFIQGVLSLTFGEDPAKPSKDKDAMYNARPEIEVLLLLLRPLFSQLTQRFSQTLKVVEWSLVGKSKCKVLEVSEKFIGFIEKLDEKIVQILKELHLDLNNSDRLYPVNLSI